MGPEAKLYKKIKRNFKSISLIRLENNSLLGTPDILACNTSGHFFTIELKVTKGNKVRFSPHQIAFHVKHPKYYKELEKIRKEFEKHQASSAKPQAPSSDKKE